MRENCGHFIPLTACLRPHSSPSARLSRANFKFVFKNLHQRVDTGHKLCYHPFPEFLSLQCYLSPPSSQIHIVPSFDPKARSKVFAGLSLACKGLGLGWTDDMMRPGKRGTSFSVSVHLGHSVSRSDRPTVKAVAFCFPFS